MSRPRVPGDYARPAHSRGYLRALDRLPAVEVRDYETAYHRRHEYPRPGSRGRRFDKAAFRRSVRRQFSRQDAALARED